LQVHEGGVLPHSLCGNVAIFATFAAWAKVRARFALPNQGLGRKITNRLARFRAVIAQLGSMAL
jgi:hypothetical protein